MSKRSGRDELVRLIAEHVDDFKKPEYVQALFDLTAQDLVNGGVDQYRVGACMIRSWVALQEASIGRVAVIEAMRNIADRLEQDVLLKSAGRH